MSGKVQERAFLESEGDQWYLRNRSALERSDRDLAIETIHRVLSQDKDQIRNILEIGCGNGKNVARLAALFDSEAYGIDPSEMAIREGTDKFKQTHLQVGTASKLPFPDNQFDLVFFGFCLYLVDRGDILKVVSEADRTLRGGGYLAILDFDPTVRHKREYHHRQGLFSYKTSYADFFTTNGQYYLVAKDSFSHSGNSFVKESDERVSVSILYKEPDAY